MRAEIKGVIAGGHTLTIEHVTQRFGPLTAVRDVSLTVNPGEFVALLGPSGCGKSTLLRVIAGFLAQSEGHVRVDGRSVDGVPPNRRGIGIVFQNYALFPHTTVAANLAYGLEARGMRRTAVAERVDAMLALVRMAGLAGRYPSQLSGGQQQRIALARALAVGPRIMLLDEPFGALDKNLRFDMQIEIKRLQRETGVTSIMVTHDQEEALSMADRIAVMNAGAVEQYASPIEVYDRPASLFVNQFVGTTNLLPGRVAGRRHGGFEVVLDCGAALAVPSAGGHASGAQIYLTVRPEHLRLVDAPAADRIAASVRTVIPIGSSVVFDVVADDATAVKVMQSRDSGFSAPAPGSRVFVEPRSPGMCLIFPQPH